MSHLTSIGAVFFAICLLLFYNLQFIFSFFFFVTKMLSPMPHLSSIRAVLFFAICNLFCEKMLVILCHQSLISHPSEQWVFLQFVCSFFYNLPFIFSFSILQKKMLSRMSHLPSIRAVGAVVTDVIAPTGNWLLHSLIWEQTPIKNEKLLLDIISLVKYAGGH